jgi:hypothetical protein
MRTGTKLNDGGPIEICFSRLLLITMTWRPFRARRRGGRFPGLKPWAKFFSPSGAINYPKSCLSSRHSTLIHPARGTGWSGGIRPLSRVTSQHSLTIDIGDLQADRLRDAQPGGVAGRQDRAMLDAPHTGQKLQKFFLSQDNQQLLRFFGCWN